MRAAPNENAGDGEAAAVFEVAPPNLNISPPPDEPFCCIAFACGNMLELPKEKLFGAGAAAAGCWLDPPNWKSDGAVFDESL